MRSGSGLGGIVGVLAMLLLPTPSLAEDTAPAKTGVAVPSVEELAIPQPSMITVDSGTAEAICLMIKKNVDYYLHFADVGTDIDQRDYIVSYAKLTQAGFQPTRSMEEGIKELIKMSQAIDVQHPYYNA